MLGSVFSFFHRTFRNRTIVVFTLTVMASGIMIPSYGQTVFNCSSFSSSGACEVAAGGPSGGANFSLINGGNPGSLQGNQVLIMPSGSTHLVEAFNWMQQVNDQAFTASFTFVPNGQNVSFVLNNNTNSAFNGAFFVGGAGCEAGFFQYFQASPNNNLFALELDSYSPLTNGGSFSYSSAQIYTQDQDPCLPPESGDTPISKISTSPVPLNSPAGTQETSSGDTYSATMTYDGNNFTLDLYDVTAGGSCPGSSCFTHTWSGVNIPAAVNGNNAWVGIVTATGNTSTYPLYIKSFSYTEGSTTTQTAATPSFSPSAGTYSGSQNVALSSATSGAVICYNTTGSPATNGSTGCASGTRYTGPVTVSSNETMYAVAGAAGYDASPMASSTYVIQPPAATPPIFSPAVGTYSSAQNVTISDATSGATIYYTTNGTTPTTSSTKYTGSIAVNTTETLKAIAVASGYTNSAVASATYTITSQSPAATVSTPWFSMPAKTYTSAQTVSIYDTTPNRTIYYTTNGSTPTTSSTIYAGAIIVSTTETLKAMAAAPGEKNSAVASATYRIKK
jgi:Chitobiase/beta-hexosaminidase C-terminal domain